MMSTQMEEHKECDAMGSQLQDGIHIHDRFHFVSFQPSPDKIEKEEAQKQYQLLTLARSRISEDIYQRMADEHQINGKLMWFTQHDQCIQWKTEEIKNLEHYLRKDEPHLLRNSVPRTTGFVRLPEKDSRTPVMPDRKRYQKRLIKKGRMDMDYMQQVKEDLLSLKKSGGMTSTGTQEVNDLIEGMAQRIQHGNKNRVDEMRIYLEMRNIKETREMYTAPEPDRPHNSWYAIERHSKYHADWKRARKHKINIRLDEIEDMKMDLKGRKARVARLKSELELVRKSISCLRKKLEDVNTKRIKAFKCAYDQEEQKKILV
ncbi:hypothetical protein L1887_14317 [Cichorium endivia]|nr:hypothetical protein L1887_14317 [Cichorium endivia]